MNADPPADEILTCWRLQEIKEELALMGIQGNTVYTGSLPPNRMDARDYQQTISARTIELAGYTLRIDKLIAERKEFVAKEQVDGLIPFDFSNGEGAVEEKVDLRHIDAALNQYRSIYHHTLHNYYDFLEHTEPVDKDAFIHRWTDLMDERGELLQRRREIQCRRILLAAGRGELLL